MFWHNAQCLFVAAAADSLQYLRIGYSSIRIYNKTDENSTG